MRRDAPIQWDAPHECGMIARVAARLSRIRAHSYFGILDNSSANHPQVAEGEQRVQLLRVLHQPAVARLKARIRAKVEHPFRVIKRQLGHRHVTQTEPLLNEMDAQRRFDGKRPAARRLGRRMRRNQRQQGHDRKHSTEP